MTELTRARVLPRARNSQDFCISPTKQCRGRVLPAGGSCWDPIGNRCPPVIHRDFGGRACTDTAGMEPGTDKCKFGLAAGECRGLHVSPSPLHARSPCCRLPRRVPTAALTHRCGCATLPDPSRIPAGSQPHPGLIPASSRSLPSPGSVPPCPAPLPVLSSLRCQQGTAPPRVSLAPHTGAVLSAQPGDSQGTARCHTVPRTLALLLGGAGKS